MAKIPQTALKPVTQKCLICGLKFKNKSYLVSHIEKKHGDQIPKDWSPSRYENYLRTGKEHGSCIVCKKNTDWNESTWKYNRLCGDPKCIQAVADKAENNCVNALGKGRKELLEDPEMQRKMIYSKKNSGKYEWTNGDELNDNNYYDSSTSKQFLEMLDVFLNLDPADVYSPSPNTYPYKYEGREHQYIPDHYIASLNLEVEIKEPKDNQNMHPKIQAVDKVKEKLKDEMMESRKDVNYIKINGNDYAEFFAYVNYLKDQPDVTLSRSKSPHYAIKESVEMNQLYQMVQEASKPSDLISLLTTDNLLYQYSKSSYTYTKLLKKLDEKVDKCETLEDCDKLNKDIVLLRKELINKTKIEDGNNRMRVEAQKAIKHIDEITIVELKGKVRYMSARKDVTEATHLEATRNNKVYRPVFVFLSFTNTIFGNIIKDVTRQDFSHASFSMDTTLKDMVSFGTKRDGSMGFIHDESILDKGYVHSKDKGYYSLYMYIATQEEYDIMKSIVNDFTERVDDLKYSFMGCLNLILGKETHNEQHYFCSQFVAMVLSKANPKLIHKDPSLTTPGDLESLSKIIKISEGKINEYDDKKVDATVKKILQSRRYTDVKIDNN